MENKTLHSIVLIIILLLLPIILNNTAPNHHKTKITEPNIKSKNQKLNIFYKQNIPQQNTIKLNLNKISSKLLPSKRKFTVKQVNLLSVSTTPLNNDAPPRVNNIEVALKKINNTIVKPQTEFSFNQQIGNLTSKNGYKPAPAIINNRLQPAYGGGVCQASSTLYNALLKTSLEITERHPHSSSVNYVPPGRDATIVPEIKDLKFKNNKQSPILIKSKIFKKKVIIFLFKIHNM